MPGNPCSDAGDPSTDAIPAEISAGERYKAMSPSRLRIARLPCAAIPSGFSPTAMIESPVFLTNIKAEPSPTTGTFAMPLIMNDIGSAGLCSPKNSLKSSVHEDGSSQYFQFRPSIRSSSRPGLSALAPLASVGSNSKQLKLSVKNQSPFETQQPSPSQLVKTENIAQPSQELALSVNRSDSLVEVLSVKSVPTGDASNELRQTMDADSSAQAAQTYSNGSTLFSAVEKSAEDGYSWRKYGQKHVKGCEFPRSYYKCTHHNCQMKKLLERSHDGQITEIIYKGRHDHPMPQKTRRSAVTAIFTSQREEKEDEFSSSANPEENFSNAHGQASHHVCPNYNSKLSPVSVSDDEVDVRGGQAGLGDEVAGADDDLQSKRRKMDAAAVEANSIAKNNREPRVVVQTVSEVDILDDGYRWRKYGQKVVKGNPNPRSYYKCTNPGCSVRKHVERASHHPKAVITTYEGKHSHDVPAAKTSGGHESSAPMITDAKTAFGNHLPAALGSIPRTYNSHQYPQPEKSYSISLHLGVGISSDYSSTTLNNKQHIPGSELVQSRHQLQYAGSDNRKPLIPENPMSNNVASGYREDREALSFSTQINYSSSHYRPVAGNLVMSP